MSSLKFNQSAFCLCVLKSYILIFHSSCSADDTRYNLMFSYIHYVGNALIVDEFKKASNIVLSLFWSPISVFLQLWYGAGFILLPLTLRPVLHP